MSKKNTIEPSNGTPYNNLVKKRLIQWKNNYEKSLGDATLNYAGIANAMADRFGILTSVSKIRDMFDPEEGREIKLSELVALCQIFDIPLWEICEAPDISTNLMNASQKSRLIKGNKSKENALSPLSNRFYDGDYYVYYFKHIYYPNQLKPLETRDISEAKITIDIIEGRTILTLTEIKDSKTFAGDPTPRFELSGELNVFNNPSIAYSFIADPTGRRFMALMFKFINLSADIRYYIPIGMMTISLNETHEPTYQKMAAFRVRQNLKDQHTTDLLRGILSLNNGPIVLDKETLEKLKEDEIYKKILSPEHSIADDFSVFLESSIMSNAYFIQDPNKKIELLMNIRKHSLYSTSETIHETEQMAEFIKDHQISQPEYKQFVEEFKAYKKRKHK